MKIQDELTSPYYIEVSGDEYAICEDKEYTSGKTGKLGTMKKTIGYYYSLDLLIKKLIKIKTESGSEVISLKQYFEKYSDMIKKFNELLKPLK